MAPKQLEFCKPSNICPSIIRVTFVIFLAIFTYFVFLSFVTNLVITAAL